MVVSVVKRRVLALYLPEASLEPVGAAGEPLKVVEVLAILSDGD